jgi:hypothetical protein
MSSPAATRRVGIAAIPGQIEGTEARVERFRADLGRRGRHVPPAPAVSGEEHVVAPRTVGARRTVFRGPGGRHVLAVGEADRSVAVETRHPLQGEPRGAGGRRVCGDDRRRPRAGGCDRDPSRTRRGKDAEIVPLDRGAEGKRPRPPPASPRSRTYVEADHGRTGALREGRRQEPGAARVDLRQFPRRPGGTPSAVGGPPVPRIDLRPPSATGPGARPRRRANLP